MPSSEMGGSGELGGGDGGCVGVCVRRRGEGGMGWLKVWGWHFS